MTSPELSIDSSQRKLFVKWSEGESSGYHFVWLRHHARCPDGQPNDTRVKVDLLPDDPESLVIRECKVEGEHLLIQWQDDMLETRHRLDVLRRSAYDDVARRSRKHRPVLWCRKSAGDIPVFKYAETQTEQGRLDLLLAVRDYGVARLQQVPLQPGSIATIAQLFGPVHVNNYGQVFDVKSDANRNLGSNTGAFLPPHTDESYRHDAPGISFFHCLLASPAGGESILVDGFEAARILRESAPDCFEVLSKLPVFFQRYALPLDDMRSHARILVTDIDGEVVGLRWTDRTLPPQDLPEEYVEDVYRALRKFWLIINSDELAFCYSMQPGDLHVFDNHRVLHGRLAFDPDSGPRHLQQCTVNRDEFHNSLRTLAVQMKHPDASLVMAGGASG